MINEQDRAAARQGMPGSSFSDGGLGYVLGANERDAQRREQEYQLGAAAGSSHNLQLVIVAACVGVPSLIGADAGWIAIPWWAWWITFFVGTYGLFFVLEWLPGWLSGGVMGLFLGGLAAYIGWDLGGVYWSAGGGLATATIMYVLFSRLQ